MTGPAPDNNAAVEFLRLLHPDGPWALTAISPDKKRDIETRTFGPDFEDAAREFLGRHNGSRNIYFAVNPAMHAMSKKARREDIAEVRYLHVDIDARAGEDLAEELRRIRDVAHRAPPRYKLPGDPPVPPPTFMLCSGGGYQLFWALSDPNPINGDLGLAEAAGLYNAALEQAYGGDNCHNIDRVMRLPGTVNIPDKRKLAKGRVPALAKMTGHHPDRVYPIDKFRAAVPPPLGPGDGGAARGGGTNGSPGVPGGVETGARPIAPVSVTDLSELDTWGVPNRVKVIIAQGEHPDQPKSGDSSRSGWLFDVVCQLLRRGVPDDVVLGIITDRGWAISESVLEQGSRAEAYALRQIQKARAAVAEDTADFHVNKDGVPYPSQHNIRVALRKLGVQLSHDQFADRLLIDGLTDHGPALQDAAVVALYLETDTRHGFRPTKEFYWMVVEDEARRRPHHPVRDYLDSLTWDGTPRVDKWLIKYGGAEDSDYVRAVGALPLLAAVRRVREPGCKFDEMLVLRSPQGTDKSSALAALCPDPNWFTDDLPLNADTKVVIERLQGRWIVEAAELKGMRRGDVEHLKSFLSRQVDRARMAYGRMPKEGPRQCVIVGTTNSERFLRDNTGNRRFWPVQVDAFDIAALRRDRDQIWAEAARREAAGESIRLDPALYPVATEAQEAHRVEDPFVGRLADVLGDLEGKLKSEDAWEIVGVPPGQRTQDHNGRLGDAMRELGWVRTKARFGSAIPYWCYVRGEGEGEGRKVKVRRKIEVLRDEQGKVYAKYEGEPF